MTTSPSLRTVVGLSLAGASLFGLAACGSSSKSPSTTMSSGPAKPSLSLMQRAQEAKVCLNVGKDLGTAAPILTQITSRKVTPAQAATELKPIATKVDALAKANTSLPIGPALTTLSTDITAAQKLNPKDMAAVRADVKKITSDAAAALSHCGK
ncbi:MAG: hypothetical protein ACTHJM_13960 [Marmoricola sp.]